MTGQYLGGRPITLSYAFKKDGQKGERHGSTAERRLADLGKKNNVLVTGFLPPSFVPTVPLPQGFSQASVPGAGGAPGAPAGVPPPGPPAAPGQYAPPAAPPGFSSATIPGQGPGFGPPPGMPPPPTGFGQYGR